MAVSNTLAYYNTAVKSFIVYCVLKFSVENSVNALTFTALGNNFGNWYNNVLFTTVKATKINKFTALDGHKSHNNWPRKL
jgi:hypothetical protein